jgi:hypothetical protein
MTNSKIYAIKVWKYQFRRYWKLDTITESILEEINNNNMYTIIKCNNKDNKDNQDNQDNKDNNLQFKKRQIKKSNRISKNMDKYNNNNNSFDMGYINNDFRFIIKNYFN